LNSVADALSDLETALYSTAHKTTPDFDDVWKIFHNSLTSSNTFPTTIVLDAIDECQKPKPFIRVLHELVTTNSTIKVLVTGRTVGPHVDGFQSHATPIIDMSQDDASHDIASFVEHKVSRMPRLRGPSHKHLRNSLLYELGKPENHGGMFLWAYLMCKDVKQQIDIQSIWSALKRLPRNLSDVYINIIEKLNDYPPELQDFSRLVLKWVVGSRRPLTFSELEEALIVSHNTKSKLFHTGGYGLLWSRKDIVDACGCLVSYTGLDDGDILRVVHLTASEFLKSRSKASSKGQEFFVGQGEADYFLGKACIYYLTEGGLQKDPFLSRRCLAIDSRPHVSPQHKTEEIPQPNDGPDNEEITDFIKRHPFLSYANLYWPNHVRGAFYYLENSFDHDQCQQTLRQISYKIELFSDLDTSLYWLEDYIKRVGIESLQEMAEYFQQLSISLDMNKCTEWFTRIIICLEVYYDTILNDPKMVHFCLARPGTSDHVKTEILRRAPQPSGTWKAGNIELVGYHSESDSLYGIKKLSHGIRLYRRMIRKTRTFIPVTYIDESNSGEMWKLDSAAIDDSGTFIAAVFEPTFGPSCQMVCWKIIAASDTIRPDEWAVLLTEGEIDKERFAAFKFKYYEDFSGMGAHVSFGANNTLITPCGIFNILSKQVDPLKSIFYRPDTSKYVGHSRSSGVCGILFSGDGTRVARVFYNHDLEVLTIDGLSILKRSFENIRALEMAAFSYSGSRIIVNDKAGHFFKLLCLDIQENKVFVLQQPPAYNNWISTITIAINISVAFTRDERNVVVLSENYLFIYPLERVDGSSVTSIITARYLSSDCFSDRILLARGTISKKDIIIYIGDTGKIVEKTLESAVDMEKWSNDLVEDSDAYALQVCSQQLSTDGRRIMFLEKSWYSPESMRKKHVNTNVFPNS
jgi:hypothetical protein